MCVYESKRSTADGRIDLYHNTLIKRGEKMNPTDLSKLLIPVVELEWDNVEITPNFARLLTWEILCWVDQYICHPTR